MGEAEPNIHQCEIVATLLVSRLNLEGQMAVDRREREVRFAEAEAVRWLLGRLDDKGRLARSVFGHAVSDKTASASAYPTKETAEALGISWPIMSNGAAQ